MIIILGKMQCNMHYFFTPECKGFKKHTLEVTFYKLNNDILKRCKKWGIVIDYKLFK